MAVALGGAQGHRDSAARWAGDDSLAQVCQDWGVLADAVRRLAEAPDTVLVLHHFATVAQARGFLTSREHRAAMRRAGVEGSPRVEIYD